MKEVENENRKKLRKAATAVGKTPVLLLPIPSINIMQNNDGKKSKVFFKQNMFLITALLITTNKKPRTNIIYLRGSTKVGS